LAQTCGVPSAADAILDGESVLARFYTITSRGTVDDTCLYVNYY
jgi:hypothetical protein